MTHFPRLTRGFTGAVSLILALCLAAPCGAQQIYPGRTWEVAGQPEEAGFSSEGLAAARAFTDELATAAVVIVAGGRIAARWGDVEGKYLTHSCRKSFLSALYGIYVADGTIDLEMTMAELGIDDLPPLTAGEKQATIRDCLKARSGVFHTALAESEGMHALKPDRGSLAPGTFWLYSNWDFNVLGTIFEQRTGTNIYAALKADIADPIGMEHFEVSDGFPIEGDRSIHYAYMFSISALDMARFGLLMLRDGAWDGRQVIPAGWVEESTDYYSDATIYRSDGYGYMWWVAHDHNRYPHFPNVSVPEGTYSARGAGGHYIVIFPAFDLVVVHRVNTWEGHQVSHADFGTFLALVLDARLDR